MSVLGFSGTSQGMKKKQAVAVFGLFYEFGLHELHHGDCVGADEEAHNLARSMNGHVNVVGHPPANPRKRAFCSVDVLLEPKPYLDRNTDIAGAGRDGLVAAPHNFVEVIRGEGAGTWSTVRRARKFGRRIWLVFPDGSVQVEVARSGSN